MKADYLIVLLITVSSFLSCESPIEMGDDGLGEVLIMNAHINTADTSHVVWLAYGTQHGMRSTLDGVVSCFVNGKLVASTDKVVETYEKQTIDSFKNYISVAAYRFDAQIAPGDHVRIVASAGPHLCQAEMDVLPRPTILDAYMFPCETDVDKQCGRNRFEIRIQDQDGVLNYYYLRLIGASHIVVEKTAGLSSYNVGDVLERKNKEVHINTTGEPLLNTGARFLGDQGSSQASYFDNEENLFTDLLFRDGQYTIRVFTDEQFMNAPSTMDEGDSMIVYNMAIVRVFNISREEYLSLSGYQFANSRENGSFLTEEFVFPNNVEGGIGFVSVNTATDYVLYFPTRRVTIDTWPHGTVLEDDEVQL